MLACLSLYFSSGILRPLAKSERGRFLSLMVLPYVLVVLVRRKE